RFDPALDDKKRKTEELKLAQELDALLDKVATLDGDRVLRALLSVVRAALRTNYFQKRPDGAPKHYVSVKLDPKKVPELPQPLPMFEIFVYAPEVEGIHLRAGKVARGGLRWSDRKQDFRTKVLGLMKAQQVKNAIIVPVGAKGGFVVKQADPSKRDEWLKAGVECYKTFLRGLLDITDNREGDAIVVRPNVVRYDEDDPYLVVAADKGTATFSDIANSLSAEYNHWLGDAFASGGSAGYDHKKMGITAKGGWESVKRHFREMNPGRDIQAEEFSVAGVGDMSGDVFGNGMLLSREIRLVAAFDHRHVFLDPAPDAQKSFRERERLFALPRSSWADYDAKLISKGGGIYPRSAKSIPLSPEIRAVLGVQAQALAPNELISAILRAPVDLLYNGGIGTYVKSGGESNVDVGDRANDAIRVNGSQLRCKVVAEGGNLGFTQRGRIEYALAGGRINTDAIDNSAGVDCSDHEVNIKILTGMLEIEGKLDRRQRDKLLAKMTDEVGRLVLSDNYLQTQSISVTEKLSGHLLDRQARFMRTLEKAGRLNREIEFLPNDEQVGDRLAAKRGLTRPELAILMSYAKLALYDELLPSDLPDDPALEDDLRRYFPGPLQQKYSEEIGRHPLRREIVATMVTNDIVNRMGVSFVHEVRERTGLPPADIGRAYLAAREIFGATGCCHAVEELDGKVPAQTQYEMLVEIARLVERGTGWLLREHGQHLPVDATVAFYREGARGLIDGLEQHLTERHRGEVALRAKPWIEVGVPERTALRVAAGPWLIAALDVVNIARKSGHPVEEAGRAHFSVGERFGFDWLRRAAAKLSTDTAWDKLAVSAVMEELGAQQAEMAARVLAEVKGKKNLNHALEDWAEARRPLVARAEQLMGELGALAQPTLAMLTVASRQLRSLLAG
ncbi:MAG TPA: NAD-glutamate dehydrogenase domain-containing protein, partial [Kiloniellales bacterium]|nr:NAD-glutamate dehydrogenase domain-containing protein [Kiloniellales bacterium]